MQVSFTTILIIFIIINSHYNYFLDAKNFYLLEDWTLDQDNREITNFLRNFHIFHKYNSRSAYKIASQNYLSDKDNDVS